MWRILLRNKCTSGLFFLFLLPVYRWDVLSREFCSHSVRRSRKHERHLDYYFCVDGKRVFWGDSNKKFHTQHIKLRMYSLSTSIQSSSSSFCPLSPSHIPGIPWDEISSEAGFQDQILRPVCIHGIFICCLWRTRDSGIAVLVLIVGHSFSFFSDGSLYDGSVLSSFGNIVVVTIDICLVSISLTFLLWIL